MGGGRSSGREVVGGAAGAVADAPAYIVGAVGEAVGGVAGVVKGRASLLFDDSSVCRPWAWTIKRITPMLSPKKMIAACSFPHVLVQSSLAYRSMSCRMFELRRTKVRSGDAPKEDDEVGAADRERGSASMRTFSNEARLCMMFEFFVHKASS